MKFSTREDIEAPVSFVFERMSDFALYERRALRHGAQIVRHGGDPVRLGTTWDIDFVFRERERHVRAELTRLDAPTAIEVASTSDGMSANTTVDLVALSLGRTRIIVGFELRARSLTARLLLQSLKMAKTRLNKRFAGRVAGFAGEIEEKYRNPSAG